MDETIALLILPATKIRDFLDILKKIIQAFPYGISLNGGQKEPYFIAEKLPAYYGLYSCYIMFLLPSRSEVHHVWFGSRDWCSSWVLVLGCDFARHWRAIAFVFLAALTMDILHQVPQSHPPPSTRLYHKHDIVLEAFFDERICRETGSSQNSFFPGDSERTDPYNLQNIIFKELFGNKFVSEGRCSFQKRVFHKTSFSPN